jgi:starch phosphorylase
MPSWKKSRKKGDLTAITERKKILKQTLFKTVADQCGKLFDPTVLTIVWARRFAGYKRPDLLVQDDERFNELMNQTKYPIQFIWAGKPYPSDEGATHTFNSLVYLSHLHKNMAVLTGYELALSKQLKDGSDLWLNTPVVTREASGTSGMTAAMNAGINFSTFDGWICEFAEHQKNAFIVPVAAPGLSPEERDAHDRNYFFDQLEREILPMYYEKPADWNQLTLQSMNDVNSFFNSNRMAAEYYEKVY